MNGPEIAIATWTTQYYLTTSTAHGTVTGAGWYNAGTTATATLNSAFSPGTTGIQYAFTNWGTDASGIALTSNAITMNGPKTASTVWQTQYNLTITQSGVGSDYTGNLITVNGNNYDLPPDTQRGQMQTLPTHLVTVLKQSSAALQSNT